MSDSTQEITNDFLTATGWQGQSYSGGWVDGLATPRDVIEKATGAVLATVDQCTPAQLTEFVERARAACPAWAADGVERARVLRAAAAVLEEARDEYAEWIIRESGSVPAKAHGEITDALAELENAAQLALADHGVELPALGGADRSIAERVPYGVVGIITPWNVPLLLAMRSVAPALGLGNAVILKPDNQTAVCGGILIARLFEEAGAPPGVVAVIPGAGAEIGEAIVTHPGIPMVSFTGSTVTGRRIATLAAPLLKKVALELGGKNPHVVLADADLEGAVAAGVWGTYQHQGQVCMAIGRHVVDATLADDYATRMRHRVSLLRAGDPFGADVHLGPLINQNQADQVQSILDDARERGAVVTGGERRGNLITPAVVSGVTAQMRAYREEIFGPVAVIIVADDDEDAARIANDTEYGLSASVHSADLERAGRVADAIHSGMVHLNGQPINDNPWSPMGGVGASGSGGRFGGPANVEMFTFWRWRTSRAAAERGFFPDPS